MYAQKKKMKALENLERERGKKMKSREREREREGDLICLSVKQNVLLF